MSVVIELHFKTADVAGAEASFDTNRALLEEITNDAKQAGGIHHRFLEGDGELVVLDEWESEQAFQNFFENNPKIAQVTAAAGVQGSPTMSFYHPVDAPGNF